MLHRDGRDGATAILARATATGTAPEGVVLGLVLGVGIVASVAFVGGIFDPHKPEPMVWFAIFSGYQIVGLVIAAIIVRRVERRVVGAADRPGWRKEVERSSG